MIHPKMRKPTFVNYGNALVEDFYGTLNYCRRTLLRRSRYNKIPPKHDWEGYKWLSSTYTAATDVGRNFSGATR
jgi:hypothetical protein